MSKVLCLLSSAIISLSLISGSLFAQADIKTVVIDAGHGGHDPGNLGTGRYKTTEKDVSLDVALKLGDYIKEAYPDVKIVYTRKDDRFIPLNERANIANRSKADLFISIHCNSAKATQAAGTETWVMGLHRSKENLEVAMRENSVILLEDNYESTYADFNPRDPDSYIAMSLMQSAYLDQSVVLASKVQEDFQKRVGRVNRGIKQGGLLVLYKSAMPAILIELGFLTNSAEEDFLQSNEGKVYMASSIFRAFKTYKELTETIYGEAKLKDKVEDKVKDEDRVKVEDKVKPKSEEKSKEAVADGTVAKPDSGVAGSDVKGKPTSAENRTNANGPQFKVQFLTSPKRLSSHSPEYRGLKDVEIYKVNKVYKYTSGSFSNLQEAKAWQEEVRKKFPGAFMVAGANGELISVKEALKLQAEQK